MNYKKEYEKIMMKKLSELTIEDKKVIVKCELSMAMENFQTALSYAKELDFTFVDECMDQASMMVNYAEDEGADVPSFE
tara:strand:- start:169 stop:405 length:237 start_codon:yes stop_codon:yes gene_type:complete